MKLKMSCYETECSLNVEKPSFLRNHLRVKRAQNIKLEQWGAVAIVITSHTKLELTGLLKLKLMHPTTNEKSRTRSDNDVSIIK